MQGNSPDKGRDTMIRKGAAVEVLPEAEGTAVGALPEVEGTVRANRFLPASFSYKNGTSRNREVPFLERGESSIIYDLRFFSRPRRGTVDTFRS